MGETAVVNHRRPNGRDDVRGVPEAVAQAVRPGLTDREKAVELWQLTYSRSL